MDITRDRVYKVVAAYTIGSFYWSFIDMLWDLGFSPADMDCWRLNIMSAWLAEDDPIPLYGHYYRCSHSLPKYGGSNCFPLLFSSFWWKHGV